jgi:NAD(P)-dependent dehydrogenase (short-subunit alcohol dehydrogenase family)
VDLGLTDKRAIVTGGSRGLGKAAALGLAMEGCDVVLAARTIEPLTVAAAELAAASGRRIVPVQVDTGSTASVDAMVSSAVDALGGVDILVNSAAKPLGQGRPPKLADITDEVFWADVNVKVMGYLRCARAVAPLMASAGWGRVINIAGLGARVTGSSVGSMRNVAVAALTKNLADELGGSGVNVTVVHPGITRTEATPGVLERLASAGGISVEEAERSLVRNAIGRLVEADEVAAVVVFLASPRSVAIQGDAVVCGGGYPEAIYY